MDIAVKLLGKIVIYRCYVTDLNVYFAMQVLCNMSRGSVLAFSTQVRGFKPGRSRRIFKGEKILSTPSFVGEIIPSGPCRRFAECKRFLTA